MPKAKLEKKKSAKGAKSRRKPSFAPIQDIQGAIQDCRDLMDEGIIHLDLQYPFKVVFRVDEEEFEKLEKWDQRKRKNFRSLLSREVTFGLESALTDDIFPSFPLGLGPYKDFAEKEAKIIIEETRKVLVTPELKNWVLFKHSSKNHILQSVEWEINTKKRDRQVGKLEKMDYATVRLWYKKPLFEQDKQALALFRMLAGRDDKSLTLNLHYVDIKGLIDDLNKMLQALQESS